MSTATATAAPVRVLVPAAMVREHNYRGEYDEGHIGRLADDIARNGLDSPPKARAMADGTYRLVYGHCRFRAMTRVLGWENVPVVLADPDMSDADEFAEQLRENELRRSVSKADRARACLRLRDEFGQSLEQIARTMNVSTSTARSWLRCAESLSAAALADWSAEILSDVQAYTLCRIAADRQAAILDLVRSDRFSVKAFDALVDRVLRAQEEDMALGLFDMSAFTLQVQRMGEEAKADAAAAKATAAAARADVAAVADEIAALRKLLWEAQSTLRKHNPKLANRCARGLAGQPA